MERTRRGGTDSEAYKFFNRCGKELGNRRMSR